MPCGDGPTQDEIALFEAEKMLCGLCRRVEASTTEARWLLIQADPTLVEWWKRHKAMDDRRQASEAADKVRRKLAKTAKAKLTPAEREALGLRD